MVTYIVLFGISLEIVFLLLISRFSSQGHKFLLSILSLFWFLNYVLRPLIFIYCRNMNIDTSIYDFRIGSNEKILENILTLIFVGCLIFCITIFLFRKKMAIEKNSEFSDEQRDKFLLFIYFGLICGFVSILIESSQFRNPFSKSLSILAPIILSTFLWKRKEVKPLKNHYFTIIVGGVTSTYLISNVANFSKGILLLPITIFIFTMHFWKREAKSGLKIALIIFISAAFLLIFYLFQIRKLGDIGINEITRNTENLPWFLSPFLVLTNRFDQFARVTDVYFAGANPLGSYREWIARMLLNLEWNPTFGRNSISFGQEWNQMVTNQSVPGARLSNVSLSQGIIAEGLIWSGLISLVLECSIVAAIFIIVGKLLERGPLSVATAFSLIANGAIFEMGLVQFSAILNGTVKIVLFMLVVKFFYKLVTKQN